MTPLRWVTFAVAAAATVGALAIGEPQVFQLMLACGLVLVIVGAGSAAADAFPFRPVEFACSVLTIPAGLVVGLSAFLGVPPLAAALPALTLQVAPFVGKLRR